MHLYIRSSDFSTEVPEITLHDGHIPAIGPLTPDPDSTDEVFPSMEPAVWFKVLIMDSVSIDCTKRAIHWNSSVINIEQIDLDSPFSGTSTEQDMNRERRKRLSESMFIGGECYGYHNDLDELFDSAQHLLDAYVATKISSSAFHRELFALLHCYVLPNIKLNTDDVLELSLALQKQELLIQSCDEEILAKYARLDEIEKSMKKQRLRYIMEVTQPSITDLNYPQELVKCLQTHIDKDIRSEWDKIESRNEGIQQLKTESDPENSQSSNGDSPQKENELELSSKREERGSLLKNYELMISARESLHALANGGSVVANPPPKRWAKKVKKKVSRKKHAVPPNPLHNIYIELNKKCRAVEQEIQHTALKKVRMISVKEALRSAIAELKNNEETYGIDLDPTGSQRPTDILRHSTVPKHWQTLTERVSRYLKKGGSVSKLFHEFQMQVLTQCQGLLDEHETFKNAVDLQTEAEKETAGINAAFTSLDYVSGRSMASSHSACFPKSSNAKTYYKERAKSTLSLAAAEAFSNNSNRNTADFLFVFDKESDYLKKGIDKVRTSIRGHFDAMVDKLIAKLKIENSQVNSRKVWLCYESYFYEATMPMLNQVYEKAYAVNMRNLQDLLPTLTIKELNIEDTFLVHLLSVCEDELESDAEGASPHSSPTSGSSDDVSSEVARIGEGDTATGPMEGARMDDYNMSVLMEDFKEDKVWIVDADSNAKAAVEQDLVEEHSKLNIQAKEDSDQISSHQTNLSPARSEDEVKDLVDVDYAQDDVKDASKESDLEVPTKAYVSSVRDSFEKHFSDFSMGASSKDSDEDSHKDVKKRNRRTEVYVKDGEEEREILEVDYERGNVQCGEEDKEDQACSVLKDSSDVVYDVVSCGSQVEVMQCDVKPRLEYLPSMTDLSDETGSSSGSIDSEMLAHNINSSSINMQLLQEAEDIVAGLRPFNAGMEPVLETSGSSTFLRSMSDPVDSDHTVPKELEAGEGAFKPLAGAIKQIRVFHPTSVTVVYHRCTWPLPHAEHGYKKLDATVECADDALAVDAGRKQTLAGIQRRKLHNRQLSRQRYSSVKFRPEISRKFQGANECLTSAITETAPLLKLQSLTTCLRKLNQQLTSIQQELGGTSVGASTDDLIDMLILLICNYDPVLACQLYPQVILLTDVMAPFFEGGPYSFSLVQFSVAFQFLQEKMILKQSIEDNAQARRDLESVNAGNNP